jgi:rRNA small subunit pseudouridine methyltransferase Nep1
MLNVILLDCALEIVPSEISSYKEIQRQAGRRGKRANEILLDQTHHGRAMAKLAHGDRRGRPDIVFHSLITLLETPLCKEGLLGVYLHLQDGRVIEVSPETRLPRNYDRFVGLMEQLLLMGRVPPEGDFFLRFTKKNLSQLVSELKRDTSEAQCILTIEGGTKTSINSLQDMLPTDPSIPVIVGIGAFPHGDFAEDLKKIFETHIELDREVMMAWHVCAEIVWSYSAKARVIETRYMQ